MKPLTLVADPCTGLVYESPGLYRDPTYAFESRNREGFRLLTEKTRAIRTPDGCTVGENAEWMQPGENITWNGPVAALG